MGMVSLNSKDSGASSPQVGLWHMRLDELLTGGRTTLATLSAGTVVALAQNPIEQMQA